MTTNEQAPKSLESLIQQAGSAVNLLRSSTLGPYEFPGIPAEFTNWRDEERAWKESVALLELSYHMPELHLRGSEVIRFLSEFAVNKFDPFHVLRAKQLVLVGHDGNMIGDAIVFHEEEDFYRVVGADPSINWLLFNAQGTSHDITATKHESWMVREAPRDVFRIQIQGPSALDLVTEVSEGTLPEIKFFNIGEFKIAGKNVRALRHGMAGTPGFEIYGPWDDQQAVRDAVEAAGEKYGLLKVGALAYGPTAPESGWRQLPVPAIYHGELMRPYREWLNTYFLETIGSLGGSFVSDKIEDYYHDPIEMGYGGVVDWNRDFLGHEALKQKRDNQRRTKVTLVWNDDDVAATIKSSLFDQAHPGRYMALPEMVDSVFPNDAVLKDGKTVGISGWPSYSANAYHVLSIAVVNIEDAKPGTELTLLWGEPDSRRKMVDRHEVREIRVTVAPAPYFDKVIKTGNQ